MKKHTPMTTIISGLVAILAGIIFLASLVPSLKPKPLKVGDAFAHVNPGLGNEPIDQPSYFVLIYTVQEIKDGRARILYRSMHGNGFTHSYEDWSLVNGVGMFDTKLN